MRNRLPLGRAALSRLLERPLVSVLAWVAFPVLFSLAFGDELAGVYGRPWGLLLALATIAGVLVALSWRSIREALRPHFPLTLDLHWGWSLVGIAVVLRLLLLESLPPDAPISFEEIQLGRESILVVLGDALKVPYRYSTLMGTIGFQVTDNTLDGLRFVFKLAGCLSIVVVAATLRRLAVGWPATLFAVFTMATLSLFVVGGAVAYENFSGFLFEALLLYCVAGAMTSRANALVWAGFAGMLGGILLHEWVSYQPVVALPPLLWLTQAICTRDAECGRRALRAGGAYAVLLALTGAPAVLDILTNPSNTLLLDPLLRHAWEREAASPDVASYLANSGMLVWSYTKTLFGQSVGTASAQYRLDGGGVIPLVPGTLFALSALYALAGWAGALARVSAVILVVMLLGAGFLANDFLVERIAAALPLLILLGGICTHSALARFQSREATANLFQRYMVAYLALLTGAIVLANVAGTLRMSGDEAVLREYQHNQYVVCLTIAEARREFEFSRVHVYADRSCDKGDDLWLYPDMTAEIETVDTLPRTTQLEPGTLVVLGSVHGLSDRALAEMASLASMTESVHTLRSRDNLSGALATLTLCYECGRN